MGEYHVIANLDKKEFIEPYALGSGRILKEFMMDGTSAMTGLALLLASSNSGGGNFNLPLDTQWEHIPGRWAGDRIVIAGDSFECAGSPGSGVYRRCIAETSDVAGFANPANQMDMFTDISYEVLGCLLEDQGFRSAFLDVESENEGWREYIVKRRREAWEKARPNDVVPSVLLR